MINVTPGPRARAQAIATGSARLELSNVNTSSAGLFPDLRVGSPETDKQALHVSQSSLLTVFFPLSMWRLYASPFSKVLLLCSPPFLSYAPAVLLRFQCRKADRPYSTQGPDDVRCPPEARPSHGLLKCSTAGRLCRPMSVASP